MIVVDTNIISYYFIKGEKTELAESVWEKDPEWVVPFFWRREFMNVVSKYCRFNGMALDEAKLLFGNALEILSEKECHTDHENVLECSVTKSVTVYDAEYVSLAKSLGIRLVTADREILGKFPETAVSMEDFTRDSGFKLGREKRAGYGAKAKANAKAKAEKQSRKS
jgi:predicted nucleic acid-binding protein